MAEQSEHIERIIDAASGTDLKHTGDQVVNSGTTHDVFFTVEDEPVCVGFDTDYDRWHVLSGRIDAPGPESDHDSLEDAISDAEDYRETFEEFCDETGWQPDDY